MKTVPVSLGLSAMAVLGLVIVLTYSDDTPAETQPAATAPTKPEQVTELATAEPASDKIPAPTTKLNATSAGASASRLTRYTMRMPNGLQISVYPEKPLHPWDSTNWFAEIPITVTAVAYDAARQETLVTVDYNWRKSDEQELKAKLVGGYARAGKPIHADEISITPIEISAYSLILRDVDRDFTVAEVEKPTRLSMQTVAFRVPMQEGADRLHERLSKHPESIQLVLRAGYQFDRIAGMTIERRAINGAWARVLETVKSDSSKAESWLVDRNAEQEIRRQLAMAVETVVKSFGLTTDEEAKAIDDSLANLDKLTFPTSPLSVDELLKLAEDSVVFTVSGAKVEAQPAFNAEALTMLKEAKSRSQSVQQAAEKISDLANNSSIDDRRFHSDSRKLVIDADASVPGIFSADFHLDKEESQITDDHLKQISQARSYSKDKSRFSHESKEAYSKHAEGEIKSFASTAKLFDLRRVSAAALAATSTLGWSVSRVVGSDLVFVDTPVALKTTPIPPEDDVVAALLTKLHKLDAKLTEAETKLTAANVEIRSLINALEERTQSDLGKLSGKLLRHASFKYGIYTGPNVQPGRVQVTTAGSPHSIGKVEGKVVGVWVDWGHHPHTQIHYTHAYPEESEFENGGVVLWLRGDAQESIATIEVHVLYQTEQQFPSK